MVVHTAFGNAGHMTILDQHVDVDQYTEDGYVVLRDALSPDEVAMLCAEAPTICRGERGTIAGIEPATRGESDDAAMRRYVAINFPHKASPVIQRRCTTPSSWPP